ncbi:hypothetical protein [Kitasatospora cineracea]|uniref:2-oxoglutarate-Fe(II)-dependent oxygenase superfamily protein n=1 Tax=Kitasatospora cineracea TaxID=88074 RepID=A0A3N4SK65_9ACTN|nr:hypothetical protein [Kitasatospora cineracea]RPE36934.1 hypothetical protein EDD38_5315 [Kitasatospora cineracea]
MPPGPSAADGIRAHVLSAGPNPFAELFESVRWEAAGKGRRAAVLTRTGPAGEVPLVRTTARYENPAQRFRAVHERLARRIEEHAALPARFDNALAEVYTNACTTMGAHSDLALDLAEESSIALFSCYRDPDAGPPRTLAFAPKGDACGGFGIPLVHQGVVVFSVAANRRFKHRILLDGPARAVDNEWLGVTFRTSGTHLRFRDGRPHLPQGEELVAASEEQQRAFYRMRRRENEETDFRYPPLPYTVSGSDLLPPV